MTRMQNEILEQDERDSRRDLRCVHDFRSHGNGRAGRQQWDSVEDKPLADGQLPPVRRVKSVSPGSFQTLGTGFIAGRDFTWADIYQNREFAVISARMAKRPGALPKPRSASVFAMEIRGAK